jgi:hypothetical protein
MHFKLAHYLGLNYSFKEQLKKIIRNVHKLRNLTVRRFFGSAEGINRVLRDRGEDTTAGFQREGSHPIRSFALPPN